MSRLKSSNISKSDREIVIRVQSLLAMASVERSDRSNTDISPKHAPGLRTVSASSPEPGTTREIRTSPSEIMYSRLPGSPSLKIVCPNLNDCSLQISATRANSSSVRSAKMAAFLSRLKSMDAPGADRSADASYRGLKGGASETVAAGARCADGASGSARRGVPGDRAGRPAARDSGKRGGDRRDRRAVGAAARWLAGGRGAGPGVRQAVHGRDVLRGVPERRAYGVGDRRGPGARYPGRAGVSGDPLAGAPHHAPRSGRRQGGHRLPGARVGGVRRRDRKSTRL